MLRLALIVFEMKFIGILLTSCIWHNGDIFDIGNQVNIIDDSTNAIQEFLLSNSHHLDVFWAYFNGDGCIDLILRDSVDRMEYMTLLSIQRC